jgi:hypothetical protein
MIIPEELVELARDRRIIPFVGAGFSDSLGLPSWDAMLRGLCDKVEGSLPFDELQKATGNDYLQMAEYLFLKADKRIGPLRRHIDRALVPNAPALGSGPHVELLNLGSQQIYTTNYDDLIETTYRSLGLPVDVVVLPKDIALANPKRTQVVKYHGDLDHEESLVLTESAYYRRLDFDSPMDLKFRSDLLGKSVLFMGYSFRDINIRIIWFKLMDMMRDIPEGDRRPSYIVRLNENPALEELYAAVGIRTIVLSPGMPVDDPADRSALLGKFLLDLSLLAETAPVAPEDAHERGQAFISPPLLAEPYPDIYAGSDPSVDILLQYGGYLGLRESRVGRLIHGQVPDLLSEKYHSVLTDLLPRLMIDSLEDLMTVMDVSSASSNLTSVVVRILTSQAGVPPRELRRAVVSGLDGWEKVWKSKLSPSYARRVLERLEQELTYQAREGADEDIAYLVDIGARLALGQLSDDDALKADAAELLKSAATIYPSVASYVPSATGAPQLADLLAEVNKRAENFTAIPWLPPRVQRARAAKLAEARREAQRQEGPRRPAVNREAARVAQRRASMEAAVPAVDSTSATDGFRKPAPGEAQRSGLEEAT